MLDDLEDDEPKRAPRKGIPDIDALRGIGLIALSCAVGGFLRRVTFEKVYRIEENSGEKRIEGNISRVSR